MFDAYCRAYESRVLRSNHSILSLHNTSAGRVLYYRCLCGGLGILVEGPDVDETLRRGSCTGEPSEHETYPAGRELVHTERQ